MEPNLIQQTIRQRRSIFPASYDGREIPRDSLVRILECAHSAPTHKRTQPWHFVVFEKTALSGLARQVGKTYKEQTSPEKYSEKKEESLLLKINQAGAVIAICVRYTGELPDWEELAATSCAVQNLWLAAASEGIGGYWSTPGFAKHLHKYLELDEDQVCLGFFYLGYHKEPVRNPLRNPLDQHVRWITK